MGYGELAILLESHPRLPHIPPTKESEEAALADEPTQLILEQLRLVRSEMADLRTVTLASVDHSRRIERRLEEVRDDLELVIKSELMGRMGHFETRLEDRLERIERRLDVVEAS